MRWLLGFATSYPETLSTEVARKKIVLLQGIRIGFLALVLGVVVFFQIRDPLFVNFDVFFPIYLMIAVNFFINSIYTFYLHLFSTRLWLVTGTMFVIDLLFLTGLIYFTEFFQSVFLFLYLTNIILAGFVFQRQGAFILALLTSICFSFLIIIGPPLSGINLFLTIGINNIAFFAVAWLSGYLSEQLNFMGLEIKARDKDIKILQDLNQLIVNNISTGLMTVDTDGIILHANPSAKSILESKTDLAGQSLNKIFPEMNQRLKNMSGEQFRNLGRFEMIFVSPRDERILLGCSVSPIRDQSGNQTGCILIFQDLTEIKRLERAIQRSEKLAAVGQLAAGIAHEIRNPLASISGSVQLLKASAEAKNEEESRLMAIVLKEIDRLNTLISEFLDFVRPEVPTEKVVDINHLLKEVSEITKLNTKLKKDIQHTLDLKAERKILGNPDKLRQVFLNFVINACQAMEKTDKAELRIITKSERGLVIVRIGDNGVGMSEAAQKRLFEPFYTTKSGGTGLGLATSHKILESHEAKIYVESELGRGTDFVVEFSKLAGAEENRDNVLQQRGRA